MSLFIKTAIFAGVLALAAQAQESSIKIKGDARYRHDWFKVEGKPDRSRDRLRARLVLENKINDKLTGGFGLASGEGSPVSNNTDLGQGSAGKLIWLDLAYINYKLTDMFTASLGKQKNPYQQADGSKILWSPTLNLEGANIAWNCPHNSVTYNVQTGAFWLKERKLDSADALIYAVQGDAKWTISETQNLKVGLGAFNFDGIKGYSTVQGTGSKGSSVDASKLMTQEYRIAELYAQYTTSDFGLPLTVSGHFLQNDGAEKDNKAWYAGFSVGKDYKLGYNYRSIEKDAALGVYAEGDFQNEGGTDGKGHEITLTWSVDKNLSLVATYTSSQAISKEEKFQRLTTDVSVKW